MLKVGQKKKYLGLASTIKSRAILSQEAVPLKQAQTCLQTVNNVITIHMMENWFLLSWMAYSMLKIYLQQSWACDIFLASRQRQRDNVIQPQGPEKIRKILRSLCLQGVATTNIVTLPDTMVRLSRQYCRVPNSDMQKERECINNAC